MKLFRIEMITGEVRYVATDEISFAIELAREDILGELPSDCTEALLEENADVSKVELLADNLVIEGESK